MIDESRIRALVEATIESARTPEEVCVDDPELLDAVRARLARLREFERELATFFPESDALPPLDATTFPSIPGYEVESVLGRGGMGVVVRARQLELKRTVALKTMLAGAYAGPLDRARFRREAEAIAALRHPNVVQVYEVGESSGLAYFTMELVEGGSLDQKLGGRPRPPREAAALVATLASAVHAAHQAGVVHRDLKPANILLTTDGTPKISDFGLARRVENESALTASGARLGTPSYMAPEQARWRSGTVGPAADVHALGAILYETLTGRPPFVGASAAETEWQLLNDEPVPPSRLNRAVPRDLETIALKCLEKDPARRYASAAGLADDLARFGRGEPVTARRTGRLERAGKWARRRPAQALAVGATLLLLAVILGGGAWIALERRAALLASEEDVQEAVRFVRASDWSGARGALERATLRLGTRSAAPLRDRIARSRSDLDLVDRLEAIRLARAVDPNVDFDREHCDRDYREAFAAAGLIADLALEPDGIVQAGRRIAASDVRPALVTALDDWSVCVNDRGDQQHLLLIARVADPDPAWRDRLRNPLLWSDPAVLDQLERDVDVGRESVTILTLFAWVLTSFGRDDLELRKQTQQFHAGDFWACFNLAESLDDHDDPDAIGYYRAALALRPTALAAHVNLGIALSRQGRSAEAIDCWMHALEHEPNAPVLHLNLGVSAYNARQYPVALEHLRNALRLDPQCGRAHALLGQIAFKQGQLAEAESSLRRAVELLVPDPGQPADPYFEPATTGLADAQRMIELERRLPDLLDGRALPASATEALEVARLVWSRAWYVASAEFYEMALREQPELADDLGSGIRWSAASAAVLAGGDRDEGEFVLDEDERARWRARALEWLRADLAAVTAHLAAGADGGGVETTLLARWREDPDFELVRAPTALAALPHAERERWEAFWADVDALLSRVRPSR